jgi:hypothetical protein
MPIGISDEELALLMAEATRLPAERQDEFLGAVAARYYASRVGMPVGFSDSEVKQLMAEAARLPADDCGAFLAAAAERYYASVDPGDIGRKTVIGEDNKNPTTPGQSTPGQCDSPSHASAAIDAQAVPVERGPINGDEGDNVYDQWRARHMEGP